MLQILLGSKTRVALLAQFFEDEKKAYYVQELIARTKLDPASVHRELVKLEEASVLVSEERGNQRYFSLNPKAAYLLGLRELFKEYNATAKKDSFFLFEEFFGYAPQQQADFMNVENSNAMLKEIGIKARVSKTIVTIEQELCKFYFIKSEFDNISSQTVDLIVSRPDFLLSFNKELVRNCDELMDFSKKLIKVNFSGLDKPELMKLFEQSLRFYERAHLMGWPQNAADFGEGLFSKYLREYLARLLQGRHHNLNDVFVKLTTPLEESFAQKEWKDLVLVYKNIAAEPGLKRLFAANDTRLIQEKLPSENKKVYEAIKKHADECGFLGYGVSGPAWDVGYFIDILASFARQGKTAAELRTQVESGATSAEKLARLEKEIGIDEKYQKIFEVARGFVFTKGYRKDVMFHYWWAVENVWRAIARSQNLSLKQVRFMHPYETIVLLRGGKINPDELNARSAMSAAYSHGGYSSDRIYSGSAAREFLKRFKFIEEQEGSINELHGECASPGKARGIAKIVNTVAQIGKMEQGNILISLATSPELIPALRKAAAIVTNAGGITCHAAIISRELAIPCVIGTKNATKVLSDGDLIEVDAGHGKVSVIKRHDEK